MGLIDSIFSFFFGSGRNVVAETVQVFRENAENEANRQAVVSAKVLEQYAAEFGLRKRGAFDTAMDSINRLPRPALALGTLGLFISAMIDPSWFAERMQGIALVPEPLWWLLGAIVSFYFGARHQTKSQQFRRSMALAAAMMPQEIDRTLIEPKIMADTPGVAGTRTNAALMEEAVEPEPNNALKDWRKENSVRR